MLLYFCAIAFALFERRRIRLAGRRYGADLGRLEWSCRLCAAVAGCRRRQRYEEKCACRSLLRSGAFSYISFSFLSFSYSNHIFPRLASIKSSSSTVCVYVCDYAFLVFPSDFIPSSMSLSPYLISRFPVLFHLLDTSSEMLIPRSWRRIYLLRTLLISIRVRFIVCITLIFITLLYVINKYVCRMEEQR